MAFEQISIRGNIGRVRISADRHRLRQPRMRRVPSACRHRPRSL